MGLVKARRTPLANAGEEVGDGKGRWRRKVLHKMPARGGGKKSDSRR